jgi:hypothetical protein
VQLSVPNHLVYEAHDYGPSVSYQSWFQARNFPDNLPGIWERNWAYLKDQGIAPVLLGEFGGQSMGNDTEGKWQTTLISFIKRHGIRVCRQQAAAEAGGHRGSWPGRSARWRSRVAVAATPATSSAAVAALAAAGDRGGGRFAGMLYREKAARVAPGSIVLGRARRARVGRPPGRVPDRLLSRRRDWRTSRWPGQPRRQVPQVQGIPGKLPHQRGGDRARGQDRRPQRIGSVARGGVVGVQQVAACQELGRPGAHSPTQRASA